MIYYVKGILNDILADSIIIETNGIGYNILIPSSYKKDLPEIGKQLKLFTYHHIREDQELLFGFLNEQQKQFFLKLTSVSGIGPKVGIKILSELSITQLAHAILGNKIATLVSLPGVGKKMAERLIIELKDKLDMVPATTTASALDNSYINDLSLALKTLGYSKGEISKAISNSEHLLSNNDELTTSIKHVLKNI
jgi:holliday junction DNA helicase RuvA